MSNIAIGLLGTLCLFAGILLGINVMVVLGLGGGVNERGGVIADSDFARGWGRLVYISVWPTPERVLANVPTRRG